MDHYETFLLFGLFVGYPLKIPFLAPTGAQEVALCVRACVRACVRDFYEFFTQSWSSLRAVLEHSSLNLGAV